MISDAETAPEPSAETTVNNVNSLIQRVAGTSLSEIENLILAKVEKTAKTERAGERNASV